MQLTPSQPNRLRPVITVAVRILVCIIALAVLACFAVSMALNLVLCGPSATARNQLTLTLLAYETTRGIPSLFLDQQTIDGIIGASEAALSGTSDPALITATSGRTATVLVTLERDIAVVHLQPASEVSLPTGSGPYYCGLSSEGVLTVSTIAGTPNATGACEAILILNGQINEGLFQRDSGYATRAAVGQTADGTIILVCTNSSGEPLITTWQELINIMTEYGAVNACCLYSGSGSEG